MIMQWVKNKILCHLDTKENNLQIENQNILAAFTWTSMKTLWWCRSVSLTLTSDPLAGDEKSSQNKCANQNDYSKHWRKKQILPLNIKSVTEQR